MKFIVCIGVSTPSLKNTPPPPLFLAKPSLKSANCPAPPLFRQSLHWNPSLKVGFFSEHPKY